MAFLTRFLSSFFKKNYFINASQNQKKNYFLDGMLPLIEKLLSFIDTIKFWEFKFAIQAFNKTVVEFIEQNYNILVDIIYFDNESVCKNLKGAQLLRGIKNK